MFTKEMMAALEADGEKLRQMTGEDHGPVFPQRASAMNEFQSAPHAPIRCRTVSGQIKKGPRLNTRWPGASLRRAAAGEMR
jgi:hypothetical protein